MTEFEADLKELAGIIQEKDTVKFRQKLMRMFDKMQISNTKKYYKSKINSLCKRTTGESYEKLFLYGFPGSTEQ